MCAVLLWLSCAPHGQKPHRVQARSLQPQCTPVPFLCGWCRSLVPCSGVSHTLAPSPAPGLPGEAEQGGSAARWRHGRIGSAREGLAGTCGADGGRFFSSTALPPCGWRVGAALAF